MPRVPSAVAAFLWVLARAHVQSITIDEATTYEVFVAPADPYHWSAGSNNHILNSLVMRLFVGVFGLSHYQAYVLHATDRQFIDPHSLLWCTKVPAT